MSNQNNGQGAQPINESTLALATHLIAIFAEFLAPIVAYLLLRDRSAFLRHHTSQALNFSITLVLMYVGLALSVVGWFLLWAPWVLGVVFRIIAAVKAANGEYYNNPLALRIFS